MKSCKPDNLVLPVMLEFDLNRRQRLVPHVKIWGRLNLAIVFVSAVPLIFPSVWALIPLLVFCCLFPGYFAGLANAVLIPRQTVRCSIHESHLELTLKQKETVYVFLDGIFQPSEYEESVWTLEHWHGLVINIPKKVVSVDLLAHLKKSCSQSGITPSNQRTGLGR